MRAVHISVIFTCQHWPCTRKVNPTVSWTKEEFDPGSLGCSFQGPLFYAREWKKNPAHRSSILESSSSTRNFSESMLVFVTWASYLLSPSLPAEGYWSQLTCVEVDTESAVCCTAYRPSLISKARFGGMELSLKLLEVLTPWVLDLNTGLKSRWYGFFDRAHFEFFGWGKQRCIYWNLALLE